jgi:hypothetical protein
MKPVSEPNSFACWRFPTTRGDAILKKYTVYLPTFFLLLSTLTSAATPALAAFWANHAAAAAIIAPMVVLVAHWLPSPNAILASK